MSFVLLCDLSGSMEGIANGTKSRIEVLRRAVKGILEMHPDAKIVCFNDRAWQTLNIDREEPYGSTDLAAGLRYTQTLFPGHTVIVSDGMPNDEENAIREARSTPGVISFVYVGPDECKKAVDFMNRIARVGAGAACISDMSKQTSNLLEAIETVLALPTD